MEITTTVLIMIIMVIIMISKMTKKWMTIIAMPRLIITFAFQLPHGQTAITDDIAIEPGRSLRRAGVLPP